MLKWVTVKTFICMSVALPWWSCIDCFRGYYCVSNWHTVRMVQRHIWFLWSENREQLLIVPGNLSSVFWQSSATSWCICLFKHLNLLFRWIIPVVLISILNPMTPFYTVSHPNPSSSPGYPNLDLMMASRGRNMSSYN